ncbi:DNA-binding response regulator [Erysipelotrichaceae bacterium I46]|uniref:response regulator transcription factor n=1 Tax=Clostridium innocuum TaxID=1522 RepID=UPI00080CA0F0|nr:response regulator transcription factor [[Clostridium] innocuum]ANU68712.1 DNA-binding response regulator [Erysipelotrichaceae bacterium I46]ASU18861.1 DNA-binding response regulator [[Clostridium] innocuum]QQR27401.1 response regulator transcription factor [[Clostridium] innocuum]
MDHNILVVEDEKGIREAIQIYLKNQGYRVFLAENGQEGLNIIKRETIHLAVVDIMMPVMDGITMTMEVRKDYDFPIIFLSAKSEDIDKITGLNIGADDYITKPFGSMELLARVRSQLRRYEQILMLKEHAVSSVNREEEIYSIGALELNSTTKEVRVDNQIVKLRPKEFMILELLMKHAGRVFSAQQIYEAVWNEGAINTETVMVHIRKLREKIELDPKHPRYLKVVWGIGYKIEK